MSRKLARKSKYWVYVVKCKDGTYYTGFTNDPDKRIERHNEGYGAKYFKNKLPVKLVYSKEYRYYKNALRAEKKIKKFTRKQKEALIKVYEANN